MGGRRWLLGLSKKAVRGSLLLQKKLKDLLHAEVYTGKDYLRLAKNEATAKKLFQKRLDEASDGQSVIYVISEKEHLPLLPQKAFRVLVTADLDVIQERFAQRIGGELPAPVAAMLEKKHGCFDHEAHDIHVVSGQSDLDEVCVSIRNRINER